MAILDKVTGILQAGGEFFLSREDAKRQFELAELNLQVQAAQQRKEAEIAAAQNTRSFIENDTTRKLVLWTLTTIAGGLLTFTVLRAAGVN